MEKRQRRRRDGGAYTVWRVRWYDASGRERSRSFDRAADARAFDAKVRTLKRSDALAELDAGTETLAEFAAEWWRLYASANLERSTLKTYAQVWNRHTLPRLGDHRLRDLTPQLIARYRADLEAEGVGPEAIRNAMAMLQGVLQRAVEWQRIRTNPVKVVRKPPAKRQRAVRPLSPVDVEALRGELLGEGKVRDAALVSVLAYAGLRPQEALALTWSHVRARTLLVEQALSDGELKGQKTHRPPRTVTLLAPLRQDLAELRLHHGRPAADAYLFPNVHGGPWTEHDWRNWRRRVYIPAAADAGLDTTRHDDLRHSFASLLIHEHRLSIVEIAQQLGHNPNVCLSTFAHVMADLDDARGQSAEDQIRAARTAATPRTRRPPTRHAAQMRPTSLSASSWPSPKTTKPPRLRGLHYKPSAGLEPATPSLPWKCSTN
jgi:integrase